MNFQYSNLYKHEGYQVKISPNQHYIANALDNRLVIRSHNLELDVVMVYESKAPIDYICWAPNSTYILTVNYEQSRIHIWSVEDKSFRAIIKDARMGMVKVMWGLDSKNVLYTVDMKLYLGMWSMTKGTLRYIYHIKYSDKCFEMSPNGEYFAVAVMKNGKDQINLYHANSFILLEEIPVETVDLQNLKWAPDSLSMAIWDNYLYHKLLVYRVDGERLLDYDGYEHGLGIKTVQWSPKGELLAIGNYDQTIHLINTDNWKFIGVLKHPTTMSETMDTNIVEEIDLPKSLATSLIQPLIDYRHIMRRPYQLLGTRPDLHKPDPKIGIGSMQFSPDGNYIYSRDDAMPNVLWIWQVKTLSCYNIVLFKESIKQSIWNPQEQHMLFTICGNQHTHIIQPTDFDQIEIIPIKVQLADFTVKKMKWNSNGDGLILMNDQLFGLSVMTSF